MDPLTITTAAAKIVNTTLQVVQTCNEYYQKYQAVDLQLICMQTQCSIIEVALLQIQDVIVHNSAHFERLRSVSVLASNYERTLGACQIVFAILKERLNKLNSHLRNSCGKPDWQLKLKVVWNDQESAMLLKNIEGQASAISLLLNAIQMKTQVEVLGLLTKKESKSILKTASDDADTLSLVHEKNASDGLPDGESVITSKLDDTEFDFDFEIINTAAYRKAFNKARSELPSKTGSQAVIPLHPPTSSGAGASETANLPSLNTPAAIHAVAANHRNKFSSSRPGDSSGDIVSSSVLAKNSLEGACDGSGGMREEQHDAGLEDQLPSIPKRKEFQFGAYTVSQIIGVGRNGEVRLAWKNDRSHQVAIKLIKLELAGLRPIQTLKGLSHPNVMRLHDTLKTKSYFAVVLEYVPGGSLAECVTTQTYLGDHVSRRLFAQIISAVGYLHRNGIMHLGLSCSKVLLDSHQNAVLTGFSNAETFDPEDTSISVRVDNLDLFGNECEFDRRDKRRFIRGDLMAARLEESCYSAPEASLYRLYEGRKADVWSCGIMLYFMLAGYLPFADDFANPGGDVAQLLLALDVSLKFPKYFSFHARDLVKRIIVARPQERADLFEVAHHSWLSDSAHSKGLDRIAFESDVDDLWRDWRKWKVDVGF